MSSCPTAYDHMNREDATALKKICDDRIRSINEAEQTEKFGEPLVERQAVEIRIKAVRINGAIHKLDYLLDKIVIRPADALIRVMSGIKTVYMDGDTIRFEQGSDPSNRNTVRWEILNYEGDFSVSIESSGAIEAAYVTQIKTNVYLPEL